MDMKEVKRMWIPYLLGFLMVVVTVNAILESIDEAKQNEYKTWGFHDGPVPPHKI